MEEHRGPRAHPALDDALGEAESSAHLMVAALRRLRAALDATEAAEEPVDDELRAHVLGLADVDPRHLTFGDFDDAP